MIERRSIEFRNEGDGGLVSGIVIPYRQSAKIGTAFTERFEPGAVSFGDVIANLHHDRAQPLARTGGGGLTLEDGPDALRARIELPDTGLGRDARELVRRGVLRGLSAEFRATGERWEGSERVITAANLTGLAIVDRAAYAGSTIEEARAAGFPTGYLTPAMVGGEIDWRNPVWRAAFGI